MPTWKLRYSEEDRWKLVNYLQTVFFQNKKTPEVPKKANFTYPDFYKESMRYPEDVSWERGRTLFSENCAHCHGLAGDGVGWDGGYLNPKPADFRGMNTKKMVAEAQGEHFAKITFGIKGAAMPSWGEVLLVEERWDLVKFIMGTFMGGKPAGSSVYEGKVPADYAAVSRSRWEADGASISLKDGVTLYGQYCATCHGDTGAGDGAGAAKGASGPPAAFPTGMSENYVYWRIEAGVPSTMMYAFEPLLSQEKRWNITAYLQSLLSGKEKK